MGVHFMFLWELFSGHWAAEVHGPIDFVRKIIIDTGLWMPLVALFISRGVSSLLLWLGPVHPAVVARWRSPRHISDDNPFSEQRLLGGFYSRIIVMHLTLIFGGMIAVALGSTGPLVLMIALKIAIDLKLHLKNDFPDAKAITAPAA